MIGVEGHGAGVDEVGRSVAEHRPDDVERPAQRAGLGLGDEHRRAGRYRGDQLPEQAGLADAGLAGHEGDGREVVIAFAAGVD